MKLRHFVIDGLISSILALAFQFDLILPVLGYRMGEDFLTVHRPQLMAVARGETLLCEALGPGFDLLAEGQSGVFSPFHSLARLVPGPLGFFFLALLVQTLAFWGMKRLFSCRGLANPPAWVGALAFGGSLCLLMRFEHLHYAICLGLFPWMILGQECAGRRGLAVSAMAGGLMLLSGGWQFFLMAFTAMLVNAWLQNSFCWRRLSAILILGLALGFVQIEPTFGALQASERSGGTLSLGHSLPWWHLAGAVIPLPFGTCALGNYVGGGPQWEFALFASLTAFWMMGFGPLKYRAAFLLFLALCLGSQVPGLSLIHEMPPFSFFRVPARWGFVAVFFLASAAAHGLSRAPVRMATWRFPVGSWVPFGFLAAGVGLGLGAGGPSAFGDEVAQALHKQAHGMTFERPWPDLLARIASAAELFWWQCLAGLLVVAMGIWMVRARKQGWLPFLVLLELAAAAHVSSATVDEDELRRLAIPETLRGRLFISREERAKLRRESLARGDGWLGDLLARKPFAASHALGWPHRDLLHHSPLHSLRTKRAQGLVSGATGAEPWLERFHVSAFMDRGRWRARPVVTGALFYKGHPLSSDMALETRLTQPLSASMELDQATLAGPPRHVAVKSLEGSLKMVLEDHRGGWLRLSRSWHEGWRATAATGELHVAPVDLIHLGVEVPPGVREVTLAFAPAFPWRGLVLSLAALFVLSVLVSGGRRGPTMSS